MSPASGTLLIAPNWVGDVVMSQPLLAALVGRDPAARVDIVAAPFLGSLFERLPGVGLVHALPFAHGELALGRQWRLARELSQQHYRHAYVLPNSLKSALLPLLAGIPQRVGYLGESRYGLINRPHRLDAQQLPRMVDRFHALAFAPDDPARLQAAPEPRLSSSLADGLMTAAALGLGTDLSLDPLQPADQARRPGPLVLCPGAEYGPAKRWPVAHFAVVAESAAQQGRPVWLLGSARDSAIAEQIRALVPAARNLCGKTTLAQAVDLIGLAWAVVTNDSGLMHIAAALQVPTIALFGSSSPGFTPPLSERTRSLSLTLPCSPCFKRECPLGHLNCLTLLTPTQVFDALAQLLPAASSSKPANSLEVPIHG